MPHSRKYYIQPQDNPYPHIGQLINERMREKGVTMSELSRRLNVSQTSILRYTGNPSLQLAIVWKIGLALQYNFLAELADLLPAHFSSAKAPAHQQELAALRQQLADKEQQIKDLEKELAIYKNIVMARG